jgi:hypothetical protein
MTDYVWVTFQKEGIHRYPAAGTDPRLESVSFLQYPHRHMFHFKVWVQVFHDDRDREFIMEKRWMESLYEDKTLELDFKSCEMIAKDLQKQLAERYRGEHRKLKIEVSEDGENGCLMIWDPTYDIKIQGQVSA